MSSRLDSDDSDSGHAEFEQVKPGLEIEDGLRINVDVPVCCRWHDFPLSEANTKRLIAGVIGVGFMFYLIFSVFRLVQSLDEPQTLFNSRTPASFFSPGIIVCGNDNSFLQLSQCCFESDLPQFTCIVSKDGVSLEVCEHEVVPFNFPSFSLIPGDMQCIEVKPGIELTSARAYIVLDMVVTYFGFNTTLSPKPVGPTTDQAFYGIYASAADRDDTVINAAPAHASNVVMFREHEKISADRVKRRVFDIVSTAAMRGLPGSAEAVPGGLNYRARSRFVFLPFDDSIRIEEEVSAFNPLDFTATVIGTFTLALSIVMLLNGPGEWEEHGWLRRCYEKREIDDGLDFEMYKRKPRTKPQLDVPKPSRAKKGSILGSI